MLYSSVNTSVYVCFGVACADVAVIVCVLPVCRPSVRETRLGQVHPVGSEKRQFFLYVSMMLIELDAAALLCRENVCHQQQKVASLPA